MSEPTQPSTQEGASEDSVDRDDGMKRLLRTAMGGDEPPRVDLLAGFQKRVRERSGGKFYADRWATSRQPPVETYLVTSVLMLAIVLALYLVLAPLRGVAKAVDAVPAPVQLLAPPRGATP